MIDLTPFLTLIYFGVILAVTWLFSYVVGLVIWGLMRKSNPQVTAAAQRVGFVIVWFVGIVFAIQELGVGVDALLLVLGLLGVAAIVALRQPLENFGAKYFSDLYTPFKIGDTIRVGDQAGKVIEVNAMSTILLSEDDQLIALPNSTFLRTSVVNLTPQAWKELIVPITLPGSVDLPAFESDMLKALSRLRLRLDPRYPPVFTLKARSPQSTDLVLTVMVRRPEDRDSVLSEVNLRLSETMERSRSASQRPPTGAEASAGH
jgi:small conductance mechanosensitive channel